jgi:Cation transporting ATPase, C-terminus
VILSIPSQLADPAPDLSLNSLYYIVETFDEAHELSYSYPLFTSSNHLSELVPATSLAYEQPESLIMKVPPRSVKTDKLTSFTLLFYAYGLSGLWSNITLL